MAKTNCDICEYKDYEHFENPCQLCENYSNFTHKRDNVLPKFLEKIELSYDQNFRELTSGYFLFEYEHNIYYTPSIHNLKVTGSFPVFNRPYWRSCKDNDVTITLKESLLEELDRNDIEYVIRNDNKDEKGNYVLSQKEIEDLINHIEKNSNLKA